MADDTQLFINNFSTTISDATVAVGATTINIPAADSATLGAIAANEYFVATLSDGSSLEVVWITANDEAGQLTVARAKEGTTALSYTSGDTLEIRNTKGTYENFIQKDAEQTLTQKTLTSPIISNLTASKLMASDADKKPESIEPTVFETGGAFEIDADKADIDFTPANYVPSTDPSEADNVDNLAAHLKGIDDRLGESLVVGVEWDQSTDTWRNIDEDGNTISPTSTMFENHPIWGRIRRVNLDTDGELLAVKGETGFALDGTNGRVMVQYPKTWVKTERPEANIYRWWYSPVARAGFEVHPWFKQGGGTERPYAYAGAYEADLYHDGTNLTLHSRTGKQPLTGEVIFAVAFDGGQNEPTIGDTLTTSGGDSWTLIDYNVASGSWAGNDAAGTLWIGLPGDDDPGWSDNEDITNSTQANTLAGGAGLGVNGAPSALSLDLGDARTYAQNNGDRWQITSIWGLAYRRILYYIRYADADSQTQIGEGIVDKASGTGFNGELTGADNADTEVGSSGTGTGDGTDGLTPVVFLWMENPWGNTWEWIDGYNAIDAEYQVLTKEGDTDPQDDMDSGQTPLSSTSAPITSDGYQSNILWDPGFELLMFPAAVAGANNSHLYDYFYAHDTGEVNVLLFGGAWSNGARAGVAYLPSNYASAASSRNIGARVEFV